MDDSGVGTGQAATLALLPVYVKGKAFFQFVCPNCQVDSIFNQMKYCPECGSQIDIRSKIVSNFIREQYGMYPTQ